MHTTDATFIERRVSFHGRRLGQCVGDHNPSASRGDVSKSRFLAAAYAARGREPVFPMPKCCFRPSKR